MRAAAAAVTGAVMALVIKKHNPELSLLLGVAVGVLVLTLTGEMAGELTALLEEIKSLSGMSPAVLSPVLKCVAIGIVTRLASDVCRDAGASMAASSTELLGALAALCSAVPLFRTFIQMIGGSP